MSDRHPSIARVSTILLLTCWLQAFAAVLSAQSTPNAGMLRFPDISHDKIVFCYAGDLWIVPKKGGQASPLASPEGHELSPKFSPDGSTIGFVGNYEGDSDLYEIAVTGGVAKRISYHPGTEDLWDYSPDNGLIYSTSGFAKLGRMQQLFLISARQPLPTQLPVPYGTNASISEDGQWLAYTPYSRDTRTWKRYRGGMASDIWLFNLDDHSSSQVTQWEGTDTFPMWHADTLYYISDAGPHHRMNIWKTDISSNEVSQVTDFSRFDVKNPSIGPGTDGEGEIVFQLGAGLRVLNLESEKSKLIKVSIPGDDPALRPHIVDAAKFVQGASISPNAKRVAVEARGEIWTAPAEHGSPRNLTRTSGVAERFPAWSPDGRWIAFFSDATGEYELMVMQSDGLSKARQLTQGGNAFRFSPSWSPDSKKIFFYDKAGAMFIHDIETEDTQKFDQDPYANPPSVSWSHDSNWLAYHCTLESAPRTQIKLLHIESGEIHPVSSGYFSDTDPAFDRQGDYLYYLSNRDFSQPRYEDVGTTFIYDDTQVLIAVPLRADVKHPLLPSSDEQTWDDESKENAEEEQEAKGEKADKDSESKPAKKKRRNNKTKKQQSATEKTEHDSEQDGKDDDDQDEIAALKIEIDGMEARSFQIPVPAGSFRGLGVANEGAIVFVRTSTKGQGGEPEIRILTLEEGKAEEKTVVADAQRFELTADGKHMLVSARGGYYVVKVAPDQKLDKKLSTEGMRLEIDRRAEWQQIFNDAWRVERDFFYDPNMHGVNWTAVKRRYARLLDDCTSRYDLSFIIREMISELNVGHAYYREGDVEQGPSEPVGLLGCQFKVDGGRVIFAKLWSGGAWDTDARNPLHSAGIQVGDQLLSVESVAVDAAISPYKYFIGKVGREVSLRVQTGDAQPRTIVVKPMNSDSELRFWDGIESTRQYVDRQSDGQVGYIYVTNTSINGQNDLFRQFYAQQEKAALIIDDRWNGGGQIPTRFIELLNRPTTNYWARRDGKDWVWPPDSHQGPKCMLINGLAGSGGDMFPALFKQAELGKLIGRRTWGGLVGITRYPTLIDGSSVTAPSFAYYENDGTWGIEGHGVDPDIEVIDDPAKMVDGGDPQLDAAIELMLAEIKTFRGPPKRPAYPDRSEMGLPDADK